MMHQIGGREVAEVGEFYANHSCKFLEYWIYCNPQASLILQTQGRVLISVARFPPKSSGPSNVGRSFGMTASGALSMSVSGNKHTFPCVCMYLQDASAHAVFMFMKCLRSGKRKIALYYTTHALYYSRLIPRTPYTTHVLYYSRLVLLTSYTTHA